MENNSVKQRESFGSRFGIVAAAAGSAIGLGNIWKFPYMAGENGGGAFLVMYLIFITIIGLPLMLSELIIGRKAQKNAIGAFKKLAPGTPWFLTGWMGVITAFVILSYYGVVAGWCLEYVFKAITSAFSGASSEQISNMFTGFIGQTGRPIFWQLLFMATTGFVVVSGVKDGIEKYSKILMPLLLVIIIILDIRSITLPGAGKGLEFLFKPDFSHLTANGVLMALGHAFFSLSLGMGTIITYGSYVSKKENLGATALQVTIADTLIALLAGVAIFPAVFAFGIDPTGGPGLVFVTLPNIFEKMPLGYLFSILFFILLSIAALTSSISILEVVVAYFVESLKLNRKKATIIATIAIALLGIPCSLSNGSASIKIGGLPFMDAMTWLTDNLLLALGGLLITIFIGWYLGRKKVEEEITSNGKKVGYIPVFMFLVKFIAPIGIAITLLSGIGILKL